MLSMNTDLGIPPVELAREAEALGIESLFVPDHSHIPVRREARYGGPRGVFADGPDDYPKEYFRNRDQLLTLAAMATVTTTLKLGTGVCLVVQRDPFYLAKQIATLDQLSDGRVLFGVGAGAPWNLEELRNHGVDPDARFRLFDERIGALKQLWTEETAEYHGRLVDFDAVYSWPKPVQRPHPPVLVGARGPRAIDRVLDLGDGWMPGDWGDTGWLGDRVEELQERARHRGRPPVEVTVNLARLEAVEDYLAMGATRCVVPLPEDPAAARAVLRRTAQVAADVAA